MVAALVLAQLVSQHLVLEDAVRGATRTTGDYRRIAADLHTYGVRPSCLVTGLLATPVGYEARCRSGQISGHNRNMTRAQVLAAAHDRPVAVLVPPHQRVPSYARGWTPRRLTGLAGHRGYRVYLSPSTPAR